jgi:hypothetical protein
MQLHDDHGLTFDFRDTLLVGENQVSKPGSQRTFTTACRTTGASHGKSRCAEVSQQKMAKSSVWRAVPQQYQQGCKFMPSKKKEK